MIARNKLKTIDLMRIDTHIIFHAHCAWNKDSGGGVSLKTEGSWGSKGSSIQIQLQGWGWGLWSNKRFISK